MFDFDGVILETGAIKVGAFRRLFASHPQHLPQIVAYHQEHLGWSRFKKFEWIHTLLYGAPLTESRAQEWAFRFAGFVVGEALKAPLVKGTIELLEELAVQRTPCYVASGTPQKELETIVSGHNLEHYFRSVHGTPDTKEKILTSIRDQLQTAAENILMVGDGFSDYRASREAGTQFVWRATEAQRRYFVDVSTLTVRDLHELKDLLTAEQISTD